MCYKEKEIQKKYWSIGEIAAMLHEENYTIRFWESEFPHVITPQRRIRGAPGPGTRRVDRFYTEKDVEAVKRVWHLLRVELYTLAGAKRQLAMQASS